MFFSIFTAVLFKYILLLASYLKNKQSNVNALRLSNPFQLKDSIIITALLAFPTSCSLWKTTTLPPLSPVANSSPDELNSTVEIMSAATQEAEKTGGENVSVNKPVKYLTGKKGNTFQWDLLENTSGEKGGESHDSPTEDSSVQTAQFGGNIG